MAANESKHNKAISLGDSESKFFKGPPMDLHPISLRVIPLYPLRRSIDVFLPPES